jgi:hypothetical protein
MPENAQNTLNLALPAATAYWWGAEWRRAPLPADDVRWIGVQVHAHASPSCQQCDVDLGVQAQASPSATGEVDGGATRAC